MPTFTLTDGPDFFPTTQDNSQDDAINAVGGNDTVNAGTGNDTVVAGAGDDSVFGEDGGDLLDGNSGNDTIFGGLGNDVLGGQENDDSLSGDAGNDRLSGGLGADSLFGDADNDTLTGETGNDSLSGGDGDDSLGGGAGSDILSGGNGNDTLSTGFNRDTADGGAGDDLFRLENPGSGLVTGGTGTDTVTGGITFDLTGFTIGGVETLLIETGLIGVTNVIGRAAQFAAFTRIADTFALSDLTRLVIADSGIVDFSAKLDPGIRLHVTIGVNAGGNVTAGAGDDIIIGTTGNDTLAGSSGNDLLSGGEGNNTLNGGAGVDTMTGGGGNDVFVVSEQADVIDSGGGIDEVRTDLAVYTVHQFVERAVYTGTGNWNVTGSTGLGGTGSNTIVGGNGRDTIHGGVGTFSGDDELYGGGSNDRLTGDFGFDWLDGGTGRDTMAGGADSDTYVVDNAGDRIIENAGEGTDVVESRISWTLGANLEFLTLTGKREINGTGNVLDNTLTGNARFNELDGGEGNDVLRGLGGKDFLIGGSGADRFEYLAFSDSGRLPVARDTIGDFSFEAGDRIDLSALDARASEAGDQAFVRDTGGGFVEGEYRVTQVFFAQYLVEVNADADALAELSILVFSPTDLVDAAFLL